MNTEATYQQKGTLWLAIGCLTAMLVMYVYKGAGEQAKDVEIGIAAAFTICVMAFVKASSDAKNAEQVKQLTETHADQMKQTITGLINSTPVSQIPNITEVTASTTTTADPTKNS